MMLEILKFCEDSFCKQVDIFDNAFFRSEVEFSRVTLILGLEIEANIEVSNRISLERLTDNDVAELVGFGLTGATLYNLHR